MSEFKVQVDIAQGIGHLRWGEQLTDAQTLERAVSLAADDAIIAHNLRRLQCDIPATDRVAMQALHRCGFRREGRLRSAILTPDGQLVDVLIYARLAVDPVYGPHGFSGVMNSVLPTKRVIAHVVFRDSRGRVLLTEPTYKQDWELPGGVVDPGESPRLGAQREVLEEIGLECALGQPVLVDWMPPHLGWGDAIEFIYDGGVLPDHVAGALAPRDLELRAVHWVPREELPTRVSELSHRRLELTLSGESGATENGLFQGPGSNWSTG
ncbi:NUDIX hydrolase [Arachnia propionica]|uniref:NUDIX hydrolase n=1 Tax=Arachnia propionica TaxID=1750 RepID=A0A3P1TCV3_9ACTN|nr:NUDIX hydrolase [Arachnia propionica]MDO5081871.1 NUDIX hydrolase [Arachnia propionica]RRD07277.1 NUDIX hydrolase [Arachnia propionica]